MLQRKNYVLKSACMKHLALRMMGALGPGLLHPDVNQDKLRMKGDRTCHREQWSHKNHWIAIRPCSSLHHCFKLSKKSSFPGGDKFYIPVMKMMTAEIRSQAVVTSFADIQDWPLIFLYFFPQCTARLGNPPWCLLRPDSCIVSLCVSCRISFASLSPV